MSYDLRRRPWLHLMTVSGHVERVGLTQALSQAHTYREVLGDHTGQRIALLRLLIALTWRAGVRRADPTGPLPADVVQDYLDRHEEGFDLLSVDRPFLQVPGLAYARPGATCDLSTLRPGRGQFRIHPTAAIPLDEAARAVVWVQAYAHAGITGGTLGDPRVQRGKSYPIGTGWTARGTVAILHGPNLAETIRLNLPVDQTGTPLPAPWEGLTSTEHTPLAPGAGVDLLTWPARRLRLLHDGEQAIGLVYSAGQGIGDVSALVGWDPAMGWTRSSATKDLTPRRLGQGLTRVPWLALPQLLDASQLESPAPVLTAPRGLGPGRLTLEIATLETSDPHRVNVVDLASDRYVLPSEALVLGTELHAELLAVCAATTEAVTAYADFARNLALAAGGSDGAAAAARTRGSDEASALLSDPYRRWLTTLDPAQPDAARERWHRQGYDILAAAAADLAAAAPPAAWAGRAIPTRDGSRYLAVPVAENFLHAQLRRVLPAGMPTSAGPAQAVPAVRKRP